MNRWPVKMDFCQILVNFYQWHWSISFLFSAATWQRFDGSGIERLTNCIMSCYAWAQTIWVSRLQYSWSHRYRHLAHCLCFRCIDWTYKITLKCWFHRNKWRKRLDSLAFVIFLFHLAFHAQNWIYQFKPIQMFEIFSNFPVVAVPHYLICHSSECIYVNKLIKITKKTTNVNRNMCAMTKWFSRFHFLIWIL